VGTAAAQAVLDAAIDKKMTPPPGLFCKHIDLSSWQPQSHKQLRRERAVQSAVQMTAVTPQGPMCCLPDEMKEKWLEAGVKDDQLWLKMLQKRSTDDLLSAYSHIIEEADVWALEVSVAEAIGDKDFRFPRAADVSKTPASAELVKSTSAVAGTNPRKTKKTDASRQVQLEGVVEKQELFRDGMLKLSREATAFLATFAELTSLAQAHSVYKFCKVLVWETGRWVGYYHSRDHIDDLVQLTHTLVPCVVRAAQRDLRQKFVRASTMMTKGSAAQEGLLCTADTERHRELQDHWEKQGKDAPLVPLRDFLCGKAAGSFGIKESDRLIHVYDAVMAGGYQHGKLRTRCVAALTGAHSCPAPVKWIFAALQWPEPLEPLPAPLPPAEVPPAEVPPPEVPPPVEVEVPAVKILPANNAETLAALVAKDAAERAAKRDAIDPRVPTPAESNAAPSNAAPSMQPTSDSQDNSEQPKKKQKKSHSPTGDFALKGGLRGLAQGAGGKKRGAPASDGVVHW